MKELHPARELKASPAALELPLADRWSAAVSPSAHGLALVLTHPSREPFQLEIALTEQGPVIRVSAVALELETSVLEARCERITLTAQTRMELSAPEIALLASDRLTAEGGHVEARATRGDMQLKANDDVQVLGERVLLNCERELPMPRWLAEQAPREVLLPRQDALGDLRLEQDLTAPAADELR